MFDFGNFGAIGGAIKKDPWKLRVGGGGQDGDGEGGCGAGGIGGEFGKTGADGKGPFGPMYEFTSFETDMVIKRRP